MAWNGMEMFRYSWDSDYTSHTCIFSDGWNRIASCRAAMYKRKDYGFDVERGYGYISYTYYLVSYASPIMCIRSTYKSNGGHITTTIWLDDIKWDVSRTTKSHIRKFIDIINFFDKNIGCEYHDIINHANEFESDKDVVLNNHVHLKVTRDYDLCKMFDTYCPWFG